MVYTSSTVKLFSIKLSIAFASNKRFSIPSTDATHLYLQMDGDFQKLKVYSKSCVPFWLLEHRLVLLHNLLYVLADNKDEPRPEKTLPTLFKTRFTYCKWSIIIQVWKQKDNWNMCNICWWHPLCWKQDLQPNVCKDWRKNYLQESFFNKYNFWESENFKQANMRYDALKLIFLKNKSLPFRIFIF